MAIKRFLEKDKKTKESRERESGKGTEELVTTQTRSRVYVGMDSVQNSLMNRLDEGKQTLLTVGPANQNRVRYFGQVSSYDFQAKICCLEEQSLQKNSFVMSLAAARLQVKMLPSFVPTKINLE